MGVLSTLGAPAGGGRLAHRRVEVAWCTHHVQIATLRWWSYCRFCKIGGRVRRGTSWPYSDAFLSSCGLQGKRGGLSLCALYIHQISAQILPSGYAISDGSADLQPGFNNCSIVCITIARDECALRLRVRQLPTRNTGRPSGNLMCASQFNLLEMLSPVVTPVSRPLFRSYGSAAAVQCN